MIKGILEDIIDKDTDSLNFYILGNNYKTKVERIGVSRKYTMDDTLIF
jgi:CRISPR-associated protein Cas2